MCTVQSKGRSKLCTLQIISIITYLHKQKIVGEWPIMSLPVLITQTECKSSANSLHLYELLFPLSSLRQEAAIHSAPLVYLHYGSPYNTAPFIHKKNSRLDHRFKKIVATSVCCICVSPCVLMSVIARQTFSIGWFLHCTRLKYPPLFPPKTHGRETGCAYH